MKKLSEETLSTIFTMTELAVMLNIEGIILENDAIRGYNDDEGVIIAKIQDFDFEFEALAISRLASFKNKIDIIRKRSLTASAEEITKNGNEYVNKLVFESDKINFDFRCALPKTVKDIPKKKMNNTPIFSFIMKNEDISVILQSISAMRSNNLMIRGKDSKVSVKLADDAGDVFDYTVENPLECHTDDDSFALTLNTKKTEKIFRRLKQEESFAVNILARNIISINVEGIDVFIIPEV